jgi:tRNA pseudouridine32 synthase / 23S rRNA pseudouridine746 synthase
MTETEAHEELPPYIVPLCEKEVQILYEDEHLLLINKPEFLLSVPGRHRLNKDCMITRIQQKYPTATVVHRLDLDTSGIMIVALNKDCHRNISRQFQERKVHKTYHAVVYGNVEKDEGTVELPIKTDWENRPLQIICHENGKHALTHYQVLERDIENNSTRLLLKPHTGRTHQLRIHMREIGHPILGCDMYAHEEALKMSPRLMLHATTLEFEHPDSGDAIFGECQPEF